MHNIDPRDYLEYNPLTGVFTWTQTTNGQNKPGMKAGSIKEDGYERIQIKRKRWFSHRLAWFFMTKKWPTNDIDHINHIKNDNRWENLREVCLQENNRNKPLMKNNTSGINGVRWHKKDKAWVADIRVDRKLIHLGNHDNLFDAVCARKSAENRYGFHPNHGRKG